MVGSMSATTIYCKVDKSWWKADGAAVAVHHWGGTTAATTWPGVRMTPVKGEADTWSYDVPADVTGLMFVRVNGSGDIADWGAKTANLTLPTDGKNLYTITSENAVWGDPGVAGEWSVYGEEPITPPAPAIPTVTVIGDMTNWESEIPFELAADSLSATLYNDNIKAGTYNFKMKIGGEWRSNGYTYHRGFTGAAGITGNAGNMTFTADIEGAYKFTWTFANDSLGFEYPELPVIIPAKFYVTGDSALVDSLAWQSNAIKSESDTLVLKLAAGSYTLKVTVDGTWNTAKGYSDLTVKADGLSTDKDNNIHFTLAEAGEVKVIYTNELFKLEGNFYVAPVVVNYYAKYAAENGDWNWHALKEAEGKWLTDTIVYYGGGMNIHSAATDEGARYYAEIAGVAAKDTAYFTFNPADSTIAATVTGKYVAPVAPDPTVAVKGSMNAWGDSIPFVLAQDKLSASLTVENIKKGTYEFKMIINGEWRSNGYTYHRDFAGAAGITGNNDANMVLQLDADGQYTFTWTFANDSLGIIFPEKPANVLENGYYLVGYQLNAWTPAAQYLFGVNPDNAQEYVLNATLTEGDSIKVVKVVDDAITTWYPAGDNYVVDAAHAGENKAIYFSPDYKQDWANFGGYFWTGSNEVVKYCEKPAGHLGDPNFGDANGRILLTIAKGNGNNVVVKIKNNNAAGNTKTGLNYLWVNAANSTGVVRYGNGTHTEADVEEVSVEVIFNEPQESYNFINIHWAYSGWEGEWAIDGLQVTAAELCEGAPQPILTNGYYLVGKVVNDWTPAAQYLFAENTEAAGEYMLSVNLTEGDSIKVVYVENDAIKTWYPGGDNYVVDANHVGTTTMYFRPNYDGNEGWFARCIFIAPTGTVDVQNVATDTKAVKVLREGQVVIIRGEHIYTIMGQMIK